MPTAARFCCLRGRIKAGLRAWFESEGFAEVECGALAASPGNEAHLHAFATSRIRPDGSAETLYLHTSPEFAAKKLLAAGETRIFEFARVFRNRERTRLHAPEFTMLEWYRAREEVGRVMEDALALTRRAAQIAGVPKCSVTATGSAIPLPKPSASTVADAFRIHAGIELLDTLDAQGRGDRDLLATRAKRAGFSIAAE